MIRRAFTMRLKAGAFEEYKRHHDNVWPALVEEIARSGIGSITTFRNGDNLFLISEVADEGAWHRLWHSEVHRRWAEVMEPLMFLTDDGIVDAGELSEIFHLTTAGKSKTKKRAARRAGGKSRSAKTIKPTSKKVFGGKSKVAGGSKKAAKR